MNLYYAIGGGLGHLTRARAFLQALKPDNESVILASSAFAEDKRVTDNIQIIQVDKSFEKDVRGFQRFLKKIFSELNLKTIYLDAFPVGIIGEFAGLDLQNVEINYVARRLRWNNYAPLLEAGRRRRFAKTFILEPLENEHQIFIDNISNEQIKLELIYPASKLSAKDFETRQTILQTQKPFWLIVHSGPESEVLELVDYASEMRELERVPEVNLILISPIETACANLLTYDLYPAAVLFNDAERIFTACGFNVMNQLKDFRHKHYFIPFERRFDDQFARAKLFHSK